MKKKAVPTKQTFCSHLYRSFFKKVKLKQKKKKKIQPTNEKHTNALSLSSFLPKIISAEIETEASELSSGMKRRVAPRVGKADEIK